MAEATARLPSFKGLVKFLFFTHNTLISVLYQMFTTPGCQYIRGLNREGLPIKKGAQFRHGLDSQYGDVVFVMERDFWTDMQGVTPKSKGARRTPNPVFGHFYRRDFVQYKDKHTAEVQGWLGRDAQQFDYRPPSKELTGAVCKAREWNISWCNVQLHLGENVVFDYVKRVYAPAWLLHDSSALHWVAQAGINTTLLQAIVSNQLPFFPPTPQAGVGAGKIKRNRDQKYGQGGGGNGGRRNLLNGKFKLYGPPSAAQHYHLIDKQRSRIADDEVAAAVYGKVRPVRVSKAEMRSSPRVQTQRHSATSSAIFLHELAYVDLQVKYMADLVASNMTSLNPSSSGDVESLALY